MRLSSPAGQGLNDIMKRILGMKRWLIVLLIVFMFPFISLIGPSRLREGILRQLTYKVIASKLTDGITSDKEKALRIFRYVHQHLYTPPSSKPAGKSILDVLVRNIAWCDQQSDTLAVLARRFFVNGGWVALYGYDNVSHHSVCVLDIEGKYRMFDPMNGYIFLTEDNDIATLQDIQNRPGLLKSEQFQAIQSFTGNGASNYFKLYEPRYKWEIHIPSTPIWLKYIDYYYDIFGDAFLVLFQDLYFKAAGVDLFLKARLKHLSFRYESAIEDYTDIIRNEDIIQSDILLIDFNGATKEIIKAEAMFFRGQAYWDMGECYKCIESLQEFHKNFPNNRWKGLSYFYLGDCYEKLEEFEKAEAFYSKAIIGPRAPRTPAPARLMKLSEKLKKRF